MLMIGGATAMPRTPNFEMTGGGGIYAQVGLETGTFGLPDCRPRALCHNDLLSKYTMKSIIRAVQKLEKITDCS